MHKVRHYTAARSVYPLRNGRNMNQLAKKTYRKMRKELLESVTIKCKKCNGKMIRVEEFHYENLYDEAIVGYSCEDCPHYYLFDNNPV